MSKTKIEWTDHTWNVVIGCAKVSAGCKNCYAEKMSIRLSGMDNKCSPDYVEILRYADYGKPLGFSGNVKLLPERLFQPTKWKKPSMVFVNSMSDLFHEDIPFEFIDEVFRTVAVCPQHTFQILTKRPGQMKKYFEWSEYAKGIEQIDNVWLGVSTENQETADERIPLLLQTPAAVKWISAEPLLSKIDLELLGRHEYIDWVVVGCESGAKKRECKIEWVENIVNQCKQAKVPVFVKQLSIDNKVVKDISKFPKHLQIREYPS